MSMKTLYILRHAEAAPGSPDEPRQLTDKGRGQAKQIGQAMREKGWCPDAIFCSPAARTKQTWEGLDLAHPKPDFKKAIYNASTSELLAIVQGAGDVESLMLVGHNPSIHALAAGLAGNGPDKLLQSVRNTFQPGTLAVYEFAGDWADVQPEDGLLKDLVIPAG